MREVNRVSRDGEGNDSPVLDMLPPGEGRLDSWKEIAEYLKRSVRTVCRWEAEENLPVHRHVHQNAGTVYAFRHELDAWLTDRTARSAAASTPEEPLQLGAPDTAAATSLRFAVRRPAILVGVFLVAALAAVGFWTFRSVIRTDGYKRELSDVVRLPKHMADAIGQAVKGKRSSDRRADLGQFDPDASRLFFQSLDAASKGTSAGWLDAIAYCQQAIEKEPNFAAAYSRMALYYMQFAFTGGVSPQQFMPQAEAAASKAIELDDALAEAHAVLGAVLYRFKWDWSAAEQEFLRALALKPDYAEGHRMFSVFLGVTGRHEEALVEAQRARQLAPGWDQAALNLGLAYLSGGQYDLAIEEFRSSIEKHPDRAKPHAALGDTFVEKGMFAEGIAELKTAVALSHRNPIILSSLGYAYARSGRSTQARTLLKELEGREDRHQYVPPSAIALIYVGLDDKQTAHAWLKRACLEHDVILLTLAAGVGLANLRSDPYFRDLFSGMGLVEH